MRGHPRFASAAALLLALTWGCQDKPEPTPTPPDMQPLLTSYDQQEGQLSKDALVQIAERLSGQLEQISEAMLLFQEVFATLGALEEDENEPGEQQQGLTVRREAISTSLDGWGRLIRRCPGWKDEAERGELNLTAIFDAEEGLGQTLWGESKACRFQPDAGPRLFDGKINFHMLKSAEGDINGWLFEFAGELVKAEGPSPFQVDLLIRDNLLYLREQVEAGQFLIGLDFSAGTFDPNNLPVFIRDGDGDWTCAFNQATLSGACDGPGGQISWP